MHRRLRRVNSNHIPDGTLDEFAAFSPLATTRLGARKVGTLLLASIDDLRRHGEFSPSNHIQF
jgi:hypothetical protein